MEQYNFTLSHKAKQDLKDIWLYIAHDNVSGATGVLDRIEQAFFKLALNPHGSKQETHTTEQVRF